MAKRICGCCNRDGSFTNYTYVCDRCAAAWHVVYDTDDNHPCGSPDPFECSCKGTCSCHFTRLT